MQNNYKRRISTNNGGNKSYSLNCGQRVFAHIIVKLGSP